MQANIVVCPHCGKDFVYSRINGVALVQLVNDIEARKRMYLKLILDAFERLIKEDSFTLATSRKIIFDNVNDFARDIHTYLGFGTESE